MELEPRIEILPPAQLKFWRERNVIPFHFVLYGRTAIALRLAHRSSEDFDFFSATPFPPGQLLRELLFAREAEVLQSHENTLTLRVDRDGPVKLSFFGGLSFGQIAAPSRVESQSFGVASMEDLLAAKLKVVWQRAEVKDYIDIAAILKTGVSLEYGLGCAMALYGETFNPAIVLKALTYFNDGDVPTLQADYRETLIQAARACRDIPQVTPATERIGWVSEQGRHNFRGL